ncbi:MAG: molybdopterin-dependent oxidoreductase [Vicinamibacteria bacterium]|nr:molybdopterin-dependent oxidoreductase [Vicinamibacteria bacterium]
MASVHHHRTCHLCEAMCGLVIQTNGGRIEKIRGDEDDPLSRGHLCPKAIALQDLHHDPDWLAGPLRKRGHDFEEISWDEAIDETADRLHGVQRAFGRSAVAVYQGNPVVHNHGALIFGQLFARTLGSHSNFSATSVDQLPQMVAAFLMYGHQLLMPVPDVDRTQHFLILGANPLASNGSLMSAPGIRKRLMDLRARGGRVVLVDPRRTETAAYADLHLAIKPEADALFLLALIHTIFAEGLARPGRLAGLTEGIDDLARIAKAWSPEVVADAVGLSPDVMRQEAREFANATSSVCYGRVGISTQSFGGLASWLMNALNVVTGNLDRPGGFMFTRPAVDVVALAARAGIKGRFGKYRSRVRGVPDFSGEWPVATLAEEIETAGKGQIKALVTLGGNPVLSTPNGGRMERALRGLDFMVSIDPYLNETSRWANLILPPASPLTRDHYDLVFHLLAVRNTAKFSPAIFEKSTEARHDWEILLGLTEGLVRKRGGDGVAARLARRVMGRLGPRGVVGLLLRFGPYGSGLNPMGGGVSLKRLDREPSGVDLGPLVACLPERLYTENKRIQLTPPVFVEDLPRLLSWMRESARRGASLTLIGRRELRSNNSWMHNAERLMKGRDRCTLLMNPLDAAARTISNGQIVRVRSRAGEVEAPVEITDTMRLGVVSLPHGFGHDRGGVRLSVARKHAGVSFNDLADDQRIDDLCGTAAFSGTEVEILGAF